MLGNTENSRAGTAKHITGKRNDSLAGKQAKRETRLQTDGMTRRAAGRATKTMPHPGNPLAIRNPLRFGQIERLCK